MEGRVKVIQTPAVFFADRRCAAGCALHRVRVGFLYRRGWAPLVRFSPLFLVYPCRAGPSHDTTLLCGSGCNSGRFTGHCHCMLGHVMPSVSTGPL